MAEVTLESVPKKIKDMFNRGFTALERGNLDYAIEMFRSCVEHEPGLTKAWKFLRAAEVKRYLKNPPSEFSKSIAQALKLPTYLGAMGKLKSGKAQQALALAEKLIEQDPVNPKYAKLFAEAAAQSNIPDAAVLTLEVVRDHNPDDVDILNWLGTLYQKVGRTSSARECFEKLCELAPNDADALKRLKDAMAIDSISGDGWEQAAKEGGSYRDVLKNKDEAAQLEREAKSQKSDSDADALIADLQTKIKGEPGNINYRRALAKIYLKQKQYDEAVAALQEAIEVNPGDPELERTLSDVRVRQFKDRIEQLREAGDEDGALAVETELLQFEFNDLQDKVERYPNDLALRYDWGVMLFNNEYYTEAIQQFQLAQRNPKNRVKALYYLALCFKEKGQHDLAMEQLQAASEEVLTMDNTKKDILYSQGEIAELMGDPQKAVEFYKEIYAADIGYKDVAQKIEQFYNSSSQ